MVLYFDHDNKQESLKRVAKKKFADKPVEADDFVASTLVGSTDCTHTHTFSTPFTVNLLPICLTVT